METWYKMLATQLLILLMMLISGKRFSKQPPKSINNFFGIRTNMSMKNKDTWEFAHKHCGKLWRTLGLILIPVSIIPLLMVFGKDINVIGTVGGVVCGIQIIPLSLSLIPTEVALKKTFDKNGIRKNTTSI